MVKGDPFTFRDVSLKYVRSKPVRHGIFSQDSADQTLASHEEGARGGGPERRRLKCLRQVLAVEWSRLTFSPPREREEHRTVFVIVEIRDLACLEFEHSSPRHGRMSFRPDL